MWRFVILPFLLLISVSVCWNTTNIVNEEVRSVFDLRRQLVSVKNVISLINKGSVPISSYIYAVGEPEPHSLSCHNLKTKQLLYKKSETSNGTQYEIFLEEEVGPDRGYKLICKLLYADKIRPAQRHRRMEEDQLMKFEGNTKFFSPYKTNWVETEFWLKNDSLVEFSNAPKLLLPNRLIYEFSHVTAYSTTPVKIVFINNDPFLIIKSLDRTIDVNHFGRIFIEDIVVIQNNGARLRGDYSSFPKSRKGKAMTDWLYTHLPASAQHIKFFDVNGNSSQTSVHAYINYITLKFRTRYPILGGWITNYHLQYDVPAYEYLLTTGNQYRLQVRGVDYVIDDKVIENAVVRIMLPEGAHLLRADVPKELTFASAKYSRFGALCVFPRQAAVLTGRNLFGDYIVTVNIDYSFSSWYLLRAPLVIILYLEVVFLVVIVFRGKYFQVFV